MTKAPAKPKAPANRRICGACDADLEDGYPTDEALARIEGWRDDDLRGLDLSKIGPRKPAP